MYGRRKKDKGGIYNEQKSNTKKTVSIETTSEFDNATITFKIDEAMLGNTDFENLMFLWYNEEEPAFVELETILDKENMTASVKTTHFSKYMVVDKTAWQEAWATELNYKADNGIDTFYTVLTIDCSGSMDWNDPIMYNNVGSGYDAQYNRKTCNRITGALEFIDNMGPNDKVAVVLFDSYAFYTLGFTNDKEALKLALQRIRNDGGTNFDSALSTSMDLFDRSILNSENIYTRIVFLSDGEDDCSVKLLLDAKMAGIVIHGIGLGSSYDDGELKTMSTATGGDYYQADSSDMLLRLYETIYLHDQFDKTDADNDGLYDIFETAGIRLINGEVIYSDPTLRDTDGDELWDGEEVISEVRKAEHFFYEVTGKDNYYLDVVSYPNLADSDGDGIRDNKDNCPLQKGIYLTETGQIVVGKLTIVSSMYNKIAGHAFLIYESYIDDWLDFTGITGGYILEGNSGYYRTGPKFYKIGIGESVSIGNTSKNMEDFWPHPFTGEEDENVAIMFNREFATEIEKRNESEQYYNNNLAYSISISERQLNTVIQTHNEMNEYNLITNNCAHVASTAWNRIILEGYSDAEYDKMILFANGTPNELKKRISNWNGCYEIDIRNILRLN